MGFFPLLINVTIIIWTVFSGQRCGPWASCYEVLLVYIHVHIHVNVHIHVSRRVMSGVWSKSVHCDLSVFFFVAIHVILFIFSSTTLRWLIGRGFASHAGDGISIPGSDRHKLLKQVVTAPLPNALQQVWVSQVLEEEHDKRMPCVPVVVWHAKESSLLNGHECWI